MSSLFTNRKSGVYSSAAGQPIKRMPFKDMVSPAVSVNALIIAALLIEKHIAAALGIAAGCAVGILIYAAIGAAMDKMFGALLEGSRQEFVKSPSNRASLAVMVSGKFLVLGALLFLIFDVMHLSIGAFVIGFLLTQGIVSIGVYSRLTKSKVTE